MRNKTITVVVSGFAGTTVAEPGGAVANSLRKIFKNSIKIVALAYTPYANSVYEKDLVDEVFLMSPLGDLNNHFNDLLRVFSNCKADIYIPTLELEVRYAKQFYKYFKKQSPKMLLPDIEQFDQVSKLGLHYFCNSLGFLYPNTIVVNNSQQLHYNLNNFTFPCLIKSTLCGAEMVYSHAQAEKAAYRLSSNWLRPALIQAYIEGEQYMLAALYDENESILQTVPAKKHLLSAEGKSAITISIRDPHLELIANTILECLPWSGPLELEFIKSRDNSLFLFEINPRFPSWIDIGSQLSNNLPAILVNHLMGSTLSKEEKDNVTYGDVLLRDTDESCVSIEVFNLLNKDGMTNNLNIAQHKIKKPSKKKHTIAITGASSTGITMPGLSIAKLLKQHSPEVDLIYLAESYHDTGCYRTDLFSSVYNVEFKNTDTLLIDLKRIHKENNISAIIPSLDRHIYPFSMIKDSLSSLGINYMLPEPESINLVYSFPCHPDTNYGSCAPKTLVTKGNFEIENILDELGPKIVLKMLGSSKACVRISNTTNELYDIACIVNNDKINSYAVQQFISGEHFAVCGLAENGKLRDSVTIKTIQSCDYGKIWMATVIPEYLSKVFTDILSNIVSSISWNGPIEIDCIRSHINEEIYCIDINPRLPAWTSFLNSTNNKIVNLYIKTLLNEIDINDVHTCNNGENYIYIKHPKNYYSKTNVIGKLLSGKEMNYRANN